MKKKKEIWLLLLVIPFAFILLVLSNVTDGERKTEEKVKIVYVSKSTDKDNAFWFSLIEGVEMGAKEYNVELQILAPEFEKDYEAQNRLIEQAVAMEPDAILLSPADYEKTTPAAKLIKEAGIVLVLIDSSMNEKIEDSLVATDNYEAGYKIGSIVKDLVNQNSKIAVVSHVKGTSTAIAREEGLRGALGEDERKIVDVVFSDSEYQKAYDVTIELLEKHPDVDIIAGLNEYSAIGAARAVKRLNRIDAVRMVGFDSSKEEIQLLEAGIFEGIVVQKAFNMGYIGLETAVKVLRGETVPGSIDSGSNTVRKDDIYTEENQKLLFPFR